jgi:hypothetical protein
MYWRFDLKIREKFIVSAFSLGPVSVSDKWNISVVICDADIPQQSTNNGGDRKTFEVMSSI